MRRILEGLGPERRTPCVWNWGQLWPNVDGPGDHQGFHGKYTLYEPRALALPIQEKRGSGTLGSPRAGPRPRKNWSRALDVGKAVASAEKAISLGGCENYCARHRENCRFARSLHTFVHRVDMKTYLQLGQKYGTRRRTHLRSVDLYGWYTPTPPKGCSNLSGNATTYANITHTHTPEIANLGCLGFLLNLSFESMLEVSRIKQKNTSMLKTIAKSLDCKLKSRDIQRIALSAANHVVSISRYIKHQSACSNATCFQIKGYTTWYRWLLE